MKQVLVTKNSINILTKTLYFDVIPGQDLGLTPLDVTPVMSQAQ